MTAASLATGDWGVLNDFHDSGGTGMRFQEQRKRKKFCEKFVINCISLHATRTYHFSYFPSDISSAQSSCRSEELSFRARRPRRASGGRWIDVTVD